MRPVLLAAVHLNVIGNVRKKSQEKTAIAKMIETEKENGKESANASAKEKENVRENEIVKIARKVEVEVKEKGIINVAGHQHHQAMKDEIMVEVIEETIQNFIKLIRQANNGQKMPPKIKILTRMINPLQL